MKPRFKTLLAGGLLALALFGVARAGPLEDGQAAYQKGDYATAMRILQPLAAQGNASAQGRLGAIYAQGLGVPQNLGQAVIWLRKAAEQGYADAQSRLGWMYDRGLGVPQDYAQALVWYRRAAEQGDGFAQDKVATARERFKEGIVANQRGDYVSATRILRPLADQGYAPRSLASD